MEREYYCHGFEHGLFDARFTLKGTTPVYHRDRQFDTEHIKLQIQVDFQTESFQGQCQLRLKAIRDGVDTCVLDAVHFKINSVRWNGKSIRYDYDDQKISITTKQPLRKGQTVVVDVNYRVVKPKLGFYFIKPTPHEPKRPTQIWTQGEDEYARYWFPCFDAPNERISTEVIATVPAGFTAISNGALVRKTRSGKKATFHWLQKIPHAAYLVTLTVGKFSELKDTWRNKPVLYYCEKGEEENTRRAFGKTPKMLDFFSNSIGVPYPYAKYAQIAAHDFIYGGMENTSATTQTSYALLDERVSLDYTSDELVAHELAHQWFGDYLTCKSWDHAWLNESFATYFDALFKRHDKGRDEYLYQVHHNAQEYLNEDKDRYRRPIVTNAYRRPSDLFDRHLYEKGSVVLFMLHQILGEKLFWKSINTYVKNNAGQVVETHQLINAIEDATGRNMRQFFDQWVFGPGHPEYRVRAWWDPAQRKVFVRTVQTNTDVQVFRMDSEMLFLTKRGEVRRPILLSKKSHLFEFALDSEPQMVLFDPDFKIMKRVNFPKSQEWLVTQLFRDKNPLGRIDAAHSLAALGTQEAIDALRECLISDAFWGVRVEVARAMGSLKREDVGSMMISCLDQIPHPKVRRAIYGALKNIKSLTIAYEIEKRFGSEKSYFAYNEGLTALGVLHHPDAEIHLAEALKIDSWNDVIRSAAIDGLAAFKKRDFIDVFKEYTKPGHHQRLRMTAARALASYGVGDDVVQKHLTQLLNDPFVLMKNTAIRALQSVGDERVVPALKKLTTGDHDGRTMRLAEEAIEKITKGFEG